MLPSPRLALSLKPNVAYLVLNFAAAWKKQTTLSSLAYAGIPYQSLGARPGALSLIIVWSRLAMVRSGSRISAIFASTALSPSPLPAFISWTRSLIAPRSSSVNALLVTVLLLADCFVPFCVGLMEFDSSFQSLSIFFTSSFFVAMFTYQLGNRLCRTLSDRRDSRSGVDSLWSNPGVWGLGGRHEFLFLAFLLLFRSCLD